MSDDLLPLHVSAMLGKSLQSKDDGSRVALCDFPEELVLDEIKLFLPRLLHGLGERRVIFQPLVIRLPVYPDLSTSTGDVKKIRLVSVEP